MSSDGTWGSEGKKSTSASPHPPETTGTPTRYTTPSEICDATGAQTHITSISATINAATTTIHKREGRVGERTTDAPDATARACAWTIEITLGVATT